MGETPASVTAEARPQRVCVNCGTLFVHTRSAKLLRDINRHRVCSDACADSYLDGVNAIRSSMFARFGARCVYCGYDPPERRKHYLTIDHFVPLAAGGTPMADNAVPSCRDCNAAKGGLLPEQFLADRPDLLKHIKAALAAVGET